MNTLAFTKYLESLDLTESEIRATVEAVAAFEEYLGKKGKNPGDCNAVEVNAYSLELIGAGQNSRERYLALARYADFIRNDDFFVGVYDFFEGPDVLSLLYGELDREVGVSRRREIVSAQDPPPFGLPAAGKAAVTACLMNELKAASPPVDYTGMLYRIRHGLPADFLSGAREEYLETGSIDAFIEKKAAQFITTLETHHKRGTLFFSQPITKEVLDFVTVSYTHLRAHET